MGWPRRETWTDWLKATLLWLALGFSLGWYYTITYYGGEGWPLPYPEALAGILVYYFSVLNADTTVQAVHWMAVFPVVGPLWVGVLQLTAPYFGGRRCQYSYTLVRFGLSALPIALLGPWLAYVAGTTAGGFAWEQMVGVALRRQFIAPWPWLSPVYLGAGLVSLALQIRMYRLAFATEGRKAFNHFVVSAIIMTLLAAGLGALAAEPLRRWLE